MKKTYISDLKNLVYEGLRFSNYVFPRVGSYFTTDDPDIQRRIEESISFREGSIRFSDPVAMNTTPRVKPPQPISAENSEPIDVKAKSFATDSLQRARDIVYAITEDRGIERAACPNRKAIMNAAERLGIEFPNL